MFQSTRIQLTIWYVVLSVLVSVIFSTAIFAKLQTDLEFNVQRSERRLDRVRFLDPRVDEQIQLQRQELNDTEAALIYNLFLINLIIIGLSSIAGYILAGRSLQPLYAMVEKQNQFIADASHELRTPLTAMKTAIEVTLRDPFLNVTKSKNVLQENLDDVDRLKELSNNLLSLAKLQTPTAKIFQDVSVDEIVTDVVHKVSYIAQQKQIKIQHKKIDGLVQGNRDQLTELFGILLDNAIKYSPEKTTISITSESTGKNIVVSVKDQGIGISETDLPHIFERFYRADTSRSHKKYDGYGLGLAIAKEVVESHQGSILAKSKIGHGTSFYVTLPLKK